MPLMELQKGQVELTDDEVLIVTGVADEDARQKIGYPAAARP